MDQFPLVFPFRTDDRRYVYDLGTNDFFTVDQEIWDNFVQREISVLTRKDISAVLADGIFTVQQAEQFILPSYAALQNKLEHDLGSLILCVSEKCNMRCSYCTYGGNYTYTRTHSDRTMSLDVARRALDYYLPRAPKPTLGFFGGEPLLVPAFMEKILEYALKKVDSIDVNLTTNGTLLRGAVVDWLACNKVNLLVSIDGIQETHDRNRRLRSGTPTFSLILDNLRKAAADHPEWFKKSVRVHMVATPPYDLRPYEELILNNRDLFEDSLAISLSFVNTQDTDAVECSPSIEANKTKEIERMRTQYFHAHVQENRFKLTVESSLFDTEMFKIHRRKIFDTGNGIIPLNGACLPALRRIYVDVDGRLHICERINGSMPVGSVYDGVSARLIHNIIENYAHISSKACRNCWAARYCPLCYVHAADNECFDIKKKETRCEAIRKSICDSFILYNSIMERNPEAFAYMHEFFML